jgi:hypothetical protein
MIIGEVSGRGLGGDEDGREGKGHRVHTEWQWPLSGAHSIMEKLAQPGAGGGCFHSIYHHKPSCCVCSS